MYLKYTKANTGGKRVFSLRRLFRGEENSPLKIYNTTLSDSGGYCIYHNPPPEHLGRGELGSFFFGGNTFLI